MIDSVSAAQTLYLVLEVLTPEPRPRRSGISTSV